MIRKDRNKWAVKACLAVGPAKAETDTPYQWKDVTN